MMNSTIKNLFILIKSALGDTTVRLTDAIDWVKIYEIASAHRITTLVYYGIKAQDAVLPEEIKRKFEEKLYKSTLLSTSNDYEISRVLDEFSKRGIYHAPLKGLVVRSYYPCPELRTVGDADIIIKKEELNEISSILNELGFNFDHESSHEYAFNKGKGLLLELHKFFIGTAIKEYFDYYKNVDEFLIPSVVPNRYEMPTDKLFVFLVVHIAKHYRTGGIGLRHFIDLYVILNSGTILDESYIKCELEALGLLEFYANIRKLLSAWFDNEPFDDITKSMTTRILSSGLFGRRKDRLVGEMSVTTLPKKFLYDIFLPYISMKQKYPVLQKCPVLLPFFWIVRIFNILFFKHDRIKLYKNKMKFVMNKNITNHNDEMKFIGLK